jgi:hypothetical protein
LPVGGALAAPLVAVGGLRAGFLGAVAVIAVPGLLGSCSRRSATTAA